MNEPDKQFAHILVIDDSEEYAYFLVKTIRKYDPQLVVVVAFTAEQGLLSVRKHDYDLILCDFKLPGITGLSFLKLCKELRPNTPIVLFTGYGSDELEKEAKRHGAFAFLHKPEKFVLITGVIRDALTYRQRLRSKPA
jgi:DNA-binding NtrC family response regulator